MKKTFILVLVALLALSACQQSKFDHKETCIDSLEYVESTYYELYEIYFNSDLSEEAKGDMVEHLNSISDYYSEKYIAYADSLRLESLGDDVPRYLPRIEY
ncbi:MAG: lipoprotein [Lachnospiraceae bacterium]|nr:lipoprotein [Lachnospiraceae bacterium]